MRLALLAVEGFHDVEAVFGVDAEQRQDDEANRSALAGRTLFHFKPQAIFDVAERVFLHGSVSTLDHGVVTWGSVAGVDGAGVAV